MLSHFVAQGFKYAGQQLGLAKSETLTVIVNFLLYLGAKRFAHVPDYRGRGGGGRFGNTSEVSLDEFFEVWPRFSSVICFNVGKKIRLKLRARRKMCGDCSQL